MWWEGWTETETSPLSSVEASEHGSNTVGPGGGGGGVCCCCLATDGKFYFSTCWKFSLCAQRSHFFSVIANRTSALTGPPQIANYCLEFKLETVLLRYRRFGGKQGKTKQNPLRSNENKTLGECVIRAFAWLNKRQSQTKCSWPECDEERGVTMRGIEESYDIFTLSHKFCTPSFRHLPSPGRRGRLDNLWLIYFPFYRTPLIIHEQICSDSQKTAVDLKVSQDEKYIL